MYELKSYKTFKGHDGEPLAQSNIVAGGKKVCEWSDDSWGGQMRVQFVNPAAEAEFLKWAKTYLATRKDYENNLYQVDTMTQWNLIESSIFSLSVEYAERKELEKAAKKGLVVRVMEGGKEEVFTYKLAYTEANVKKLQAKYGANLLEVVNEKLGLPLIDETTAKLKAENDRYKKLCKTKLLFTVKKDTGEIVVMQSSSAYSTLTAAQVRAKHPNVVEIINERYL